MRSDDTVAVTITLPKALHDAVKELAKLNECGNVSAVIRRSLYKELGMGTALELKEGAAAAIRQAEERTVKYSRRRKAKAA